jgi:hypothetical protein
VITAARVAFECSGKRPGAGLSLLGEVRKGRSATDAEVASVAVPAGGASTLLDSCEALVDEPPDAPLLGVVFILSRTVAMGGFVIGFGDPSRFRPPWCALPGLRATEAGPGAGSRAASVG